MNEELLKKARCAKSAAELKALAAENKLTLTDEQAAAYYAQLHASGEMADEELDNVAGGGCHAKDGRLVVTYGYCCDRWACYLCGWNGKIVVSDRSSNHVCNGYRHLVECNTCKYKSYERGLWLCNHPANRG